MFVKKIILKYKEIFFILLITLGFFYKLIIHPIQMVYPASDIIGVYGLEKSFLINNTKTYHDIPLWYKYIFSGSPFLANPSVAMFYPLNIFYFFLPVNIAFGYIFMLDISLLGIFIYLFARVIKLDRFSSLFVAITIMFSGSIILLFYPGHLIVLDPFIWFSLILLFYELCIKSKKLIYAIFAGIIQYNILVAGHTQIAVFTILTSCLYFLLRIIFESLQERNLRLLLRKLLLLGISLVIGFSLASIQLLPIFEFSKFSARSNGISYSFASDFSLPPKQLISFILPHFFGSPLNNTYWGKGNFWSLSGYVGVLPLVLTAVALIFIRNKYIAIFTFFTLFALIYSFGKYAPLFPLIFHHIPPFNSFRVPARFLLIYSFSIAILAGFGINFLIELIKKQKEVRNKINLTRISVALATISIISIVLTLFIYFKGNVSLFEKYILRYSFAQGINHATLYELFVNDLIFFTAIMCCVSMVFFLLIRNIISRKQFMFFLLIILLIDLFFFGTPFINTKHPKKIYEKPILIDEIKKDKGRYRVFDMHGKFLPILQVNDLENITGYESLYMRDYRDFIWSIGRHENKPFESFFEIHNIENPMILNLLNTKYIISDKKIDSVGFIEIIKWQGRLGYEEKNDKHYYYVYKNIDVLPRAYLVPNAKIIKNKSDILSTLKDEEFNPKNFVLFEKNINASLQNFSTFTPIDIIKYQPNKIDIYANLEKPGFLVLSEIWYPGWKAYDNNKEVEVLKANYIFRSLYLKKGNHNITFIYDPISYKIGKTISLLSLVLIIIYFAFYKRLQGLRGLL